MSFSIPLHCQAIFTNLSLATTLRGVKAVAFSPFSWEQHILRFFPGGQQVSRHAVSLLREGGSEGAAELDENTEGSNCRVQKQFAARQWTQAHTTLLSLSRFALSISLSLSLALSESCCLVVSLSRWTHCLSEPRW